MHTLVTVDVVDKETLGYYSVYLLFNDMKR